MRLPTLLLRLIDPAQAYFQEQWRPLDERWPTPPPRAAVPGPDTTGGRRAATEHERADQAEAAQRAADYDAAEKAVLRRWSSQLNGAVDELLAKGTVTVQLGERTIEAQVIRFWRGDSVLATSTRGPSRVGTSLSRISRDPRRAGREILLGYLARAATKG